MSAKCYLEELRRADLGVVTEFYTNPVLREFLGGPVEISIARERAELLLQGDEPHLTWAIRRVVDGEFLGIISLHPHHNGAETEVSYAVLPEYQGFGHATEALVGLLRYAFGTLDLKRILAETQIRNEPSIRLLERAGMKLKQQVERFGEQQGIFGIDAGDFDALGAEARVIDETAYLMDSDVNTARLVRSIESLDRH